MSSEIILYSAEVAAVGAFFCGLYIYGINKELKQIMPDKQTTTQRVAAAGRLVKTDAGKMLRYAFTNRATLNANAVREQLEQAIAEDPRAALRLLAEIAVDQERRITIQEGRYSG